MNEHSSRSHAIFIITVECSEVGPGVTVFSFTFALFYFYFLSSLFEYVVYACVFFSLRRTQNLFIFCTELINRVHTTMCVCVFHCDLYEFSRPQGC